MFIDAVIDAVPVRVCRKVPLARASLEMGKGQVPLPMNRSLDSLVYPSDL